MIVSRLFSRCAHSFRHLREHVRIFRPDLFKLCHADLQQAQRNGNPSAGWISDGLFVVDVTLIFWVYSFRLRAAFAFGFFALFPAFVFFAVLTAFVFVVFTVFLPALISGGFSASISMPNRLDRS